MLHKDTLFTPHFDRSPFASALQSLILNDLDPVTIWVKHKGDILHSAISQPLLPVNAEIIEASTSSVEVVDGDT